MLCFVADILKANDEVIRVMALYEDTVHRPDADSLLVDHAGEDSTHGQYGHLTCVSLYIKRGKVSVYTSVMLGVASSVASDIIMRLECGPMPNVMVALPNIGGALCSTPQSLADAHY